MLIYEGDLIGVRSIMITMAALLGAVPIALGYAGREARQLLGAGAVYRGEVVGMTSSAWGYGASQQLFGQLQDIHRSNIPQAGADAHSRAPFAGGN